MTITLELQQVEKDLLAKIISLGAMAYVENTSSDANKKYVVNLHKDILKQLA